MPVEDELFDVMAVRKGHFRLESGHHGDLWLDLELLCLQPRRIQRWARELAGHLSACGVDAVCGPLVEGAFVALMVASELDVEFSYTERLDHPERDALYQVEYRLPNALRSAVRGERVAIVNDVINAGSAVRGTFADLQACGADVVAIGALLVLGSSASTFAASRAVPLVSLGQLPNRIWISAECPLCAANIPLENAARPDP